MGKGRRKLSEEGGWCRGDTGLMEESSVGGRAFCAVVVFVRGKKFVIEECRHFGQWCVEDI